MKHFNFLRTLVVGALLLLVGNVSAQNVAKIGSTEYETLEAAFTAAQSGQTITLLADLENTGNVSLKAGVILDGDNHKISGNSAIHINAAGGAVKNVVFENIHNINNTLSAVYASSLTGALSITDCSFDNVDWDAIQITPLEGASITITGNTFTHTGTENCTQIRYIHIQHTATAIPINAALTIQNNRFYKTKDTSAKAITTVGIWTVEVLSSNVNLTGNYFEYEGDILNTYAEVKRDASFNTYCDKLFPAIDNNGNDLNPVQVVGNIAYLTQDVAYAVKFNNTYKYYTLANLIEAGKTTAILLRDVNENVTLPEGMNLNIQHGTYKLEGTIINNGTLNLYTNSTDAPVSTATITNNGTVIMNCNAATGYTINGGKVEITNGGTYDLSKIKNAESIVISGGTFTTKPDDGMLKDFYVAEENSNGTYTVRKMTQEEAIAAGAIAYGTTTSYGSATNYYKTLENIAEYAVVLMKDAIGYELSSVNYIYLNTNGHTFRGSINTPGHYTRIDKSFGVEVTDVTGKELNIGAYNEAASATIKNAHDLATLQVNAKGACTIEGGNYDVVKVQWRYENGEIIKGSLTIKGGTFKSNTVTIATSGKPKDVDAPKTQPLSDYVAAGYVAKDNGDGTYTVFGATTQKNDETEETHNVQIGNEDAPVAEVTVDEVKSMVQTATSGNNITAVNLAGLTDVKGAEGKATIAEIRTKVVEATGSANTVIIVNEETATIPVRDETPNIIVKSGNTYTCKNLVLTDGANFATPVDFTATSIAEYTRGGKKWGTLCLPYEITCNDPNVSLYVIDESKPHVVVDGQSFLKLIPKTTLEANTPCLYRKADGKESEVVQFNSTDNLIKAGGAGHDMTGTIFNLHGVYATTTLTQGSETDNYYFISNNQFWGLENGASVTVNPFRAYLTLVEDPGFQSGSQNARSFGLMIDDEVLTGIEAAEAMEALGLADGKYIENGKVVIVKNGQKYNLNGTK